MPLFLVCCAIALADSRPCVFSSAIHGRRVTSLCLPKEKSPRERAPSRPRFAGLPRPANYASGLRSSLTVRPCTDSERTRILRVPFRADPSPARRCREGTREEQTLLLWVPSVTRRRADGRGRAQRAGGARDRAAVAAGQGGPVGKTPAAQSAPFAQRRARHRGRVLFGDFLLHEQEKVTRRPGWPARPAGRRVGSANTYPRYETADRIGLPSDAHGRITTRAQTAHKKSAHESVGALIEDPQADRIGRTVTVRRSRPRRSDPSRCRCRIPAP